MSAGSRREWVERARVAEDLGFDTVDEVVTSLHRARERFGFSYFVTRDAAATGPVIAALGVSSRTGAPSG